MRARSIAARIPPELLTAIPSTAGALAERGARALAVRRQVGGPERTDLAEALDTAFRRDSHDSTRQRLDDTAARHDIAAVDVIQVVAKHVNAGDLH